MVPLPLSGDRHALITVLAMTVNLPWEDLKKNRWDEVDEVYSLDYEKKTQSTCNIIKKPHKLLAYGVMMY